jgi:hypothetical protein
MAIGFRRVITFTTHDRMVDHGWLTRITPGAALGGRMRIVANVRLRFARANRFTATAGLRQPLLVHDVGSLKNNDIHGAQTQVLTDLQTASPPWFGNLAADAGALLRRSRSACHGWLTSAAPGAATGGRTRIIANVRRRFARAIRFTATAGLRQPLLVVYTSLFCARLFSGD